MNSVAMKPPMSDCPTSWMVMMFGWLREEAASASWWKRRTRSSLCPRPPLSSFEGDAAMKALVLREEDLAHAAPADAMDHAVAADELAGRCRLAIAVAGLDT